MKIPTYCNRTSTVTETALLCPDRKLNFNIFTISKIYRQVFTIMIVMACSILWSSKSHAQTITLNEKNTPIKEVFSKIKKQSGYSFLYQDNLLNRARPVTVNIAKLNITVRPGTRPSSAWSMVNIPGTRISAAFNVVIELVKFLLSKFW